MLGGSRVAASLTLAALAAATLSASSSRIVAVPGRGDAAMPGTQASGAISGRLIDSTGAPIPNAFVTAIEAGPVGAAYDNRLSLGTRTDEGGAYEIAPVLPETYLVYVQANHITFPDDLEFGLLPPGRVARPVARFTSEDGGFYSPVDSNLSVSSPQAPDGRETVFITTAHPSADVRSGTPVTVEPGQHRTNIDITMRSAPRVRVRGVVSATPRDSLSWRTALRLRDPESRLREPVASTRARQDGTFEFLSAPPGDWLLEAFRELSGSDVARNDPAGLSARAPIAIRDDDIDDLEMRLVPGVAVRARLEFDGRPPDDDPRQLAIRLANLNDWTGNGEWTTTPDAFVATGVGPGDYRLVTRIPGWRIASVTRDGRDITGQPIQVARADVAGLVVSFTRRATDVAGSVVSPAGREPSRTDVVLFPVDHARFTAATIERTTASASGTFQFRDVIPGEYFVVAVPEPRLDDWPVASLLDELGRDARRVTVPTGSTTMLELEVIASASAR